MSGGFGRAEGLLTAVFVAANAADYVSTVESVTRWGLRELNPIFAPHVLSLFGAVYKLLIFPAASLAVIFWLRTLGHTRAARAMLILFAAMFSAVVVLNQVGIWLAAGWIL